MFFSAATVVALAATTLAWDECNENTQPGQIRLAYAGPNGMAVSWNTNQQLSNPTVYFGQDVNHLDGSASSHISTTYPTSTTYSNHVVIQGLQPETKYYYIPECGTQVYTFKTSRPAGKGGSFKFAMVGDMGTMGPLGLSTTVGKGAANPLAPGETNSIQSLQAFQHDYKFVWHGLSPWMLAFVFSLADLPQRATLPMPMPGSRRRRKDTSRHTTSPITA
jgi:acid phosphatase type 7